MEPRFRRGGAKAESPEEAARARVRALLECARREPRDARLQAELGEALWEAGLRRLALEALERAHYLRPDSPEILWRYGAALVGAGRAEEARLRFEAALALDPAFDPARRALAELSPAEGDALPLFPPPVPEPLPGVLPPAEAAAWEPEPLPGFVDLFRRALHLWSRQPLLWGALWIALHAVVRLAAPLLPDDSAGVLALAETAALAFGAPAILPLVAWQSGPGRPRPPDGRTLARRWRRGAPFALVAAAGVAPVAWLLAERAGLPPERAVAAALLAEMPLHALLAPALARAAAGLPLREEAASRRPLPGALRGAGKRILLRAAVLAGAGALAVGVFGGLLGAFAAIPGAGIEPVQRILNLLLLALFESGWAAAVLAVGLDGESSDAPPPDGAAP